MEVTNTNCELELSRVPWPHTLMVPCWIDSPNKSSCLDHSWPCCLGGCCQKQIIRQDRNYRMGRAILSYWSCHQYCRNWEVHYCKFEGNRYLDFLVRTLYAHRHRSQSHNTCSITYTGQCRQNMVIVINL